MHTTDDLLQDIAKLRVFCSSGSTHLTLDVTGYYR
jgi:hypothetical protein